MTIWRDESDAAIPFDLNWIKVHSRPLKYRGAQKRVLEGRPTLQNWAPSGGCLMSGSVPGLRASQQ